MCASAMNVAKSPTAAKEQSPVGSRPIEESSGITSASGSHSSTTISFSRLPKPAPLVHRSKSIDDGALVLNGLAQANACDTASSTSEKGATVPIDFRAKAIAAAETMSAHSDPDLTACKGLMKSSSKLKRKNDSNSSYGRWTPAEHSMFLQGLKKYGREWKKVAAMIPTRTSAQIRSHAQKYFSKLTKENSALCGTDESEAVRERVTKIISDPMSVEKEVEEKLKALYALYGDLQGKLANTTVRKSPEKDTSHEKCKLIVNNSLKVIRYQERELHTHREEKESPKDSIKRLLEEAKEEMGDEGVQLVKRPLKQLKSNSLPNLAGVAKNNVGPASAALAMQQQMVESKSTSTTGQKSYDRVASSLELIGSVSSPISFADLKDAVKKGSTDSLISQRSQNEKVSISLPPAVNHGEQSPSRGFISNEIIAIEVLGGSLSNSVRQNQNLSQRSSPNETAT